MLRAVGAVVVIEEHWHKQDTGVISAENMLVEPTTVVPVAHRGRQGLVVGRACRWTVPSDART